MSEALRSLLVAGASGLIGRQLLAQALAMPALKDLRALVRRLPAAGAAATESAIESDTRLHWQVVDFGRLGALPAADGAVCALGTTIKVAGSQAAFRAVDFDAVLAFAQAARAAGASRFAVVSALGADPASSVFYNRVKGEMEAALQGLGFASLLIARPSLLVGDRAAIGQPVRLGERLGLALSKPLGRLIPQAWRPIQASVVARALLRGLDAAQRGVQVLESARLQQLGRA